MGALIATLLLAPLLLWPGRWSPLALAALAALGVAWVLLGRRPASLRALDLPLCPLLALGIVGLLVSPDRAGSLPAFYRLMLGVALLYGVAAAVTGERVARWALLLLALGGAALALVALVGVDWDIVRFFPLPLYRLLPRLSLELGSGDLFNPRIVGMALGALLPVALAGLFYLRSLPARLACAASAAGMAGVLALTQSIQGALAAAAGLLALAAWRTPWALLALPVGGLGLAILWLFNGAQWAPALLSTEHPLGIAVILRLDIWGRAWAMLRDMPYTGIGLDAFPAIQTHFYPGLLLGPEPHAHNLYLQVALDLGLPGLACWLALLATVAGMAWRARRRSPRRPRALLVGSVAGLAGFLASGLLDTLWTAKPAVLFWILLGTTVAACTLTAGERARGAASAGQGRRRSLALLAAALALLLASALLFPARVCLNWGLLTAHRALLQVQAREGVGAEAPPASSLPAAASSLEAALARAPGSPEAWRTLGSVHAWLGTDERAVACLEQGVALDVADPLRRYAPFERWARALRGDPTVESWQDLLWVYGHWSARYPQRAEGVVQTAFVWQRYGGDPARAAAVLKQGLDRGALPDGLIRHALAGIEGALP